MVALVASKLDSPFSKDAALALGRLKAKEYASDIICQLSTVEGLAYITFLVALELMNDRSVVAPLREWLLRAPPQKKKEAHNVLVRLTGYEPVLPLNASITSMAHAIDVAWSTFNDSQVLKPGLAELKLNDSAEATFTLYDTAGAIRIDYDSPAPNSSWPRWYKSLLIAGQKIYNIGSDCGTCETFLRLTGWPDELAALQAQQVRLATEDVTELNQNLFQDLDPLLKEFRPGHYIAMLIDLDIERVLQPTHSWWFRRRQA